MTTLIATSFTRSLRRLTGHEQAAVKVAVFDIQHNADSPGLALHRIDRCQDPDFWSARVNQDIRIVLHKRDGNTLLAYVDHHDDAYRWAQRRRLDNHPTTGAAQIVEIQETVEEIVIRRFVEEAVSKPVLFADVADEVLLSWGVPTDWLGTVRQATDDTLLDIASHLPDEAQEAVLAAAVGEAPVVRLAAPGEAGYSHPDARRRFQLIVDDEALAAALDAPWDDWTIFLHPAQRDFVERNFNGPARVIGSAGTGKTVVALHRAVRLARDDPNNHVLVTTFSPDLAEGLAGKIGRLAAACDDIAGRITVDVLSSIARQLAESRLGSLTIVSDHEAARLIEESAAAADTGIDLHFLLDEWRLIVDAWDINDADTYRELPRLGRKVRMAASRRDEVWRVFAAVRAAIGERDAVTEAGLMHRLSRELGLSPFTHVVVDEAQDISVPELHLISALAGERSNGMFFAGDIGQRIFRSPFPWKAVGVDVQGRSRSLKVNFRTSHQIRAKSDLLLPSRLVEADGGEDNRLGVSSVFHGPQPELRLFEKVEEEVDAVSTWLNARLDDDLAGETIAILVRSETELPRAMAAVAASRATDVRPRLMHEAKGREFRAVAIMACDADVLPSESRLAEASDGRALREIFDTERHLLYVAATRARERLWISAAGTPSEFLDDLLVSERLSRSTV